MWELILAVCAILGVVAFFRLSKQIDRIDRLEAKLEQLMARRVNIDESKPLDVSLEVSPPVSHDIYHDVWKDSTVGQVPKPPPPAPALAIAKPHIPDVFENFFLWLKDNWAGFLGVSILVLGITFGTVYLSYFASPFIRFLLLIAIGLLFLGVAVYIRKNPIYRELSSWLQSASGAIILFSVLATGFLPVLHFYESPLTGLVLVCAGLAYNLLLAYLAPKEVFASFHVLISLIALMVVPKDLTVLMAASIVAMAGIGLSVRNAWNINLLISFVSFSIFHIIWFRAQSMIGSVALYGVVCASLVGASALLIHYQKSYQKCDVENNLITHLTIWLFLAVQLALYNLGFKYLFIPLGIATIACFSMSLYAKHKDIQWLFSCDAIVGQILATLTILSLTRVQLDYEIIVWIAFIEALSFTTITYWFKHYHISKVGVLFLGGAYIWLCGVLIVLMPHSAKIIVMAVMTLMPLYLTRTLLISKSQEHDSLDIYDDVYPNIVDFLFFALGYLSLLIAINTYSFGYMCFIAVLMIMPFHKKLMNQKTHKLFYLVFATLSVIFSWTIAAKAPTAINGLLFCGLPPLALLGVMLEEKTFILDNNISSEDWWVYLLGLHIAIICVLLLWPISAFLPGVSFLIAGLLFFEAAMLLNAKMQGARFYIISIACKNMAIFYLLVYSLFYMLLYLPSEATLFDYASLSQVLTLIAIGLGIYWYFSKPILQENYPEYSAGISIDALKITQVITFDIAFVLLMFLLISSFSAPIHPIGYGCIGLVLSAPLLRAWLPQRAMIYAIGLLMAACTQVAVVSSKWASPLSDWYHDTHITGPISLILAIGIASFLLTKPSTHDNKLLKIYYQNPVLIGLLPVFISLGLFLMWRFDKSYLTMLWVVEIVIVVAVGFILKCKKLVQLALLFLMFCVGRLIVYDLAQTALIVKAGVFIVVGLLMILIHVIYKKYASRLS